MTYIYRLTLDEHHCRTMIRRFYEQQPVLLRPEWQFGVGAAALVVLLPLLPFEGNRIGVFLLSIPVSALSAVIGLAVVRIVTYQNFRYSPYFGHASACIVSEEGLRLPGVWRDELVQWSKFQWAVRHSDGILMLRRAWIHRDSVQLQPRRLCWLPDTALEAASSSQDVTRLVSNTMALRHVA